MFEEEFPLPLPSGHEVMVKVARNCPGSDPRNVVWLTAYPDVTRSYLEMVALMRSDVSEEERQRWVAWVRERFAEYLDPGPQVAGWTPVPDGTWFLYGRASARPEPPPWASA